MLWYPQRKNNREAKTLHIDLLCRRSCQVPVSSKYIYIYTKRKEREREKKKKKKVSQTTAGEVTDRRRQMYRKCDITVSDCTTNSSDVSPALHSARH